MEISHIEHIGIAVTSLDEAIPFYENILGFKCFAIEEVEDQKVRTAFFQVGPTKIELLEATAPRAPLPNSSRKTVAAAESSTLLSPLKAVWPTPSKRFRKKVAA